MSMDLGVFFTSRPHTDEEALKRYIAYCEEDDLAPYIEASPKVDAFLTELTESYPQIDDVSEAELDDCPWSCAFDVSEGHILMPINNLVDRQENQGIDTDDWQKVAARLISTRRNAT